jgi:tape measure domain-containing protein
MAAGATTVSKIQYIVDVDTKGLDKGLSDADRKVDSLGKNIASGFGDKAIGVLKKVGVAALGTATAITGAMGTMIATGGFDRAMGIEQAQFKLKGLGHDTESVDAIMKNALASVKGTAFGLGDAATVAASAVAAGVKPGQELERTLKLVADASAISGRSMTDMGAIFNKVAAAGKLTGQELNQLTDAGIPVLQLLGDQMGKSAEEVRELVSAGKVGFPEFQAAIEAGMGGAALTMGQTFSGAVANVKAAMGRLGEGLITPFTQALTPALGIAISLIDDIAAGTTDEIDSKTEQIGQILQSAIENLIVGIGPILQNMIPVVVSLINQIAAMLPQLVITLLPTILDAAIQLILGLVEALPSILEALIAAVPIIVDAAIQLLQGLIQALPIILPKLLMGLVQLVITLATELTKPELLTTILQAGITLLLELVKAVPDMIVALVEALPQIIDSIIQWLTDPNTIMMLISAAVELFMGIVKAVPKIIGALIGAFGSLFKSLWDGIVNIFIGFGGKVAGAIGDAIKGGINGILGIIEGAINLPFNLINGAIDIINLVPGVNIGKIPTLKIPRLYMGAIVEPGGRIIQAGDGGEDEWVVPESKMASLMNQLGGNGAQPVTINLYGTFATSASEQRKVAQQIYDRLQELDKARMGAQ